MKIYNRKTMQYETITQFGGDGLKKLYKKRYKLFRPIFTGRLLNELYAYWNMLPMSTAKIGPFIEKYGVNCEELEGMQFHSFADFFERKIDMYFRPLPDSENTLIAPADSKLLVYPIDKDMIVEIKGLEYSLEELTGGYFPIEEYAGGKCLIFRLTMDDYHHFHHVDTGHIRKRVRIKGKLHTVSRASKNVLVYKENKRIVNLIHTKHFDDIFYIEVGAMLAGKIVENDKLQFAQGEEKGYFKLGGSTIVLLLKPGTVMLDDDIVRESRKGIETKVLAREQIGIGLLPIR